MYEHLRRARRAETPRRLSATPRPPTPDVSTHMYQDGALHQMFRFECRHRHDVISSILNVYISYVKIHCVRIQTYRFRIDVPEVAHHPATRKCLAFWFVYMDVSEILRFNPVGYISATLLQCITFTHSDHYHVYMRQHALQIYSVKDMSCFQ